MQFKDAAKVIRDYESSELATKERNDCSVRAFAGILDTNYEPAHEFVEFRFCREEKQGVVAMPEICDKMAEKGDTYNIDGVSFKIESLTEADITNEYKLKGEIIKRQKTVKSFVSSHQTGSYLVFVSGHVFAVKDGTIIDNNSEEYRPTRKVIAAVKIVEESNQLELF